MLVENQKVEVKWNAHNVKWYVGKGYTYTKNWGFIYVQSRRSYANL